MDDKIIAPFCLCDDLLKAMHHPADRQGQMHDWVAKIAVLFEAVMTKLYERQMGEKRFHGDETRWAVFEEVDGKMGASLVSLGDAVGLGGIVPHGSWAWGRCPHSAFCQVAQGPDGRGIGV